MLLEDSSNKKALDLIMKVKLQWKRYEYAFWTALDDVTFSATRHSKIIDHLTNKNLEKAAKELDKQWTECCTTKYQLKSKS